MRESVVEKYLKRRVKAEGGLTRKFVSPNQRGVVDQLVVFAGGRVSFVEVKAPGEKAKPHQVREHNRLKAMGCTVRVIDSKEGVDAFIAEMTP